MAEEEVHHTECRREGGHVPEECGHHPDRVPVPHAPHDAVALHQLREGIREVFKDARTDLPHQLFYILGSAHPPGLGICTHDEVRQKVLICGAEGPKSLLLGHHHEECGGDGSHALIETHSRVVLAEGKQETTTREKQAISLMEGRGTLVGRHQC